MSDPRTEELEAELAALRPSLARCVPRYTPEQIDILEAKRAFRELLERKELSARAAARLLGCSASRIDGWLNPGDLRRAPPKHIYQTLARKLRDRDVLLSEAERCIKAASGIYESYPPPRSGTGTDG